MALKPLTASQKKVLDAVARIHIYAGMEKECEMDGFKALVMKKDPVAGQAERYLKKSVARIKAEMRAQLRSAPENPDHG